ncbi:beta-alanine-activating enzyme isoform X2 [Microplitis demolitor]|uniref:beta-alanine-activating enzyme isoform X2 n=1 Tax=Microplitis demolitor TaxID=69319 RepID=UPI0004CCDE00|nr:beta-alanine-activating enzyme isoform X2 [Microplitis demolitor]
MTENATKRLKKLEYDLNKIINWENLDKVAVEHNCSGNSFDLTYSQVHEAKNIIKDCLNKLDPSEFIGIYYDTPIYCIPSLILGILSSGRAFVFISKNKSEFLKEALSIQYIFHSGVNEDCGKLIQTSVIHQQSINLSKVVARPSSIKSTANGESSKSLNYFAYAVTTSGSTGQPVVVKVSHASILLNIQDFKNILRLSNGDRVAQLTPLTFDPSYVEIFISFVTGATLCTVSDELKNHPHTLLKVLHDKKITFVSTTPSLFLHRWKLRDLELTLLSKESSLRFLLLGGEPFPNPQIISRIKHPDNYTRIFNVYGITEVSCWASINEVFLNATETAEATNKLGTVLSDTIFQVRAEDSSTIDEGEGILYIGSWTRICLLGDEKLSDLELPVFRNTGDVVVIKKNNAITFKDRRDSCVKRFGSKIYLNELKSHLCKLNFIEDVQIIVPDDSSQLNLFFTTNEIIHQKDNLISDVWSHVKLLPAIMHPDKIHCLEYFKITERGKICKDYLKKSCTRSSVSECEIKKLFENIWRNHLPAVDESAGFLDLGGTSIIALQISSSLYNETGNNYPELIGMLFDNKKLKDCQDYIFKYTNSTNDNLKELNFVNNVDLSTKNNSLENKFVWQKCRGRTVILNNESASRNLFNHKANYGNLISIKLGDVYNLKKCVDASPTIFGYSDDQSFACVSSHSGLILTVDLKNKDSWQVQLSSRIEASILVLDNFKGIVGCHDKSIYCLHLKTGQIFWSFKTENIVKCLAVVCSRNKNIFIGSYDHFVYCISLEGSLVWKRKVYGSTLATPLVQTETDTVIFSLLNADCICMDQKTGDVLWKYQSESSIFSTPNILSNTLILADVRGNVVGLDINNGNEVWNFSISGFIFSDIVISTDDSTECFIFTSKNGFIYKYRFDENKYPKLHYQIDLGSSIATTPWIDKNFMVAVKEDGELRAINLKDGKFLSHFKLNGDCFSSPVIHNDLIVVGSRDDNIYILSVR